MHMAFGSPISVLNHRDAGDQTNLPSQFSGLVFNIGHLRGFIFSAGKGWFGSASLPYSSPLI
jgi:hypothetical protein